jgi:hypothetical protein
LEQRDTDRYGRIVGIVIVGSININENLLQTGLAWHYKHFDKTQSGLKWRRLQGKTKKRFGRRKILLHLGSGGKNECVKGLKKLLPGRQEVTGSNPVFST